MANTNWSSQAKTTLTKGRNLEDNIQNVYGKQTRTTKMNNKKTQLEVEIWEKFPNKGRLEIISKKGNSEIKENHFKHSSSFQDQLSNNGDLIVQNGEIVSIFFKEQNKYKRLQFDDVSIIQGSVVRTSFYESLFESDKFTISYTGNENVLNRNVDVFSFTPAIRSGPFLKVIDEVSVWVDRSTGYPLKISKLFGNSQTTVSETHEFSSINFNKGVPESVFDFIPPKGATKIGED